MKMLSDILENKFKSYNEIKLTVNTKPQNKFMLIALHIMHVVLLKTNSFKM